MNYQKVLEKAIAEAKAKHPKAPVQHHAAFANSVAYLVTGASGGYGGPSCREHSVSHSVFLQSGGTRTTVEGMNAFVPSSETVMPGQWDYESACNFADPLCFGELQNIHYECYRSEHCFDDAPSDIVALKKWQHRDESH